ncbi:MAG: extracellular solute-binding protein [Defluviitaleaceae bacterium]|nr:extracellular solute-binding protein [Defluviitaleaceae bacterium]
MKKIARLITLIALPVMLSFFAACNDNGGGTAASGDADRPFAGQTISLGLWPGNDNEEAGMAAAIEEFYELTGITVELRHYHDYQVQLQAELVGGIAPDVFYMEAFLFPSLVETGVLYPLDGFMGSDFDANDFFAPALNAFRHDGGIYGLPKDMSTLGLIYNIDLLAAAGFTPSDIPNNIVDFAAFVEQVHNNSAAGVNAFVSSSELARHLFLLEANGTSVADADGFAVLSQPNQHPTLQLLMDGFHAGIVGRPADLGYGWSGDAMGLGNTVFIIEGNWVIGHLNMNFSELNYGTREIPLIEGANRSMLFTVAYSMNSASNNKEAAWEFINFITGTQGMYTWTDIARVLPTRASVADATGFANDPILAPFVAAGAYATPWQKGETLPIIMREYNNFLPLVIAGEMTIVEAMQQAEEAANRDIDALMR